MGWLTVAGFLLIGVSLAVFYFCAVWDHKKADEDSENLYRSLKGKPDGD